jgi:hypothetical protein
MMQLIQKIMEYFKVKEPNIPGYLGRDLSKHRLHSSRYDDLCK